MRPNNNFDDIVAGFYRAAGGAIGWVDALVPFQRAMSAVALTLIGVDLSQGGLTFSYDASDLPAEASLDYIRTYHKIDPRAQLVMTLPTGGWMHCWEHFDDDFVAHDLFYQDFLIPYGGRYSTGGKLLQDGTESVILGVHRGAGSPPAKSDFATCKRLARHLTDALVLYRANQNLRQQGGIGMTLLSRLRAPLVLLDDQRRILYTNPAAQTLLTKSGALIENGARLFCRRSQDDSALMIGLRRLLVDKKFPSVDAPTDKIFFRARSAHEDTTLGLYLFALRPKETMHAFGDQPVALLVCHEPGKRIELDPFVIAVAFELTPGEARVAVATGQGLTAEQIARAHGVTINTVRSQLRSIFDKTGTARQAELVSVLAGLPMASLGLGGV